MELSDRLEHLRWLRDRYRRTKKLADERQRQYKEFEVDLYHYLSRNSLDGVNSGGYTYALRSTAQGTIVDQDRFEQWCRDNDLHEDYLRSEPQKARLNELVRERLDNQQELPPGVNAHAKEYVSITER